MAEQLNPYIDANLLQAQKHFNPKKNEQFEKKHDLNVHIVTMPREYKPSFSSGVYGSYSASYAAYYFLRSAPAIIWENRHMRYGRPRIFFRRGDSKQFRIELPYQFNVVSFGVNIAMLDNSRGYYTTYTPIHGDFVRNDDKLIGNFTIRWRNLKTEKFCYEIGRFDCMDSKPSHLGYITVDIHAYNLSFETIRDQSRFSIASEISESEEKMWFEWCRERKIQKALEEKERIRQEKIKNSYVDSHLQQRIDRINKNLEETDKILDEAVKELQDMLPIKQNDEEKAP
eukprot:51071_1